jgi:pimeloyl-ACP methyl ester carboxylesterase
MGHDRWRIDGTARVPVVFGDGVRGNIYHATSATGPAPAVIWLHPYSFGSGYNEGYGVEDTTVYHRLAREGLVVLACDQLGFGLRLLEGRDFYLRHPRWSRLGRMVDDVRAAVDFLAGGKGAARGVLPQVSRERIFVLGYSLGGLAGLHAAALDARIAGVASYCGFTPFRTDTDARRTGGVRRLWEWYALLPLLGLYHGREGEIPYDVDDVLSLIAPRPCLIVSPGRDREANPADVRACVERAREAWKARGAEARLTFRAPDDTNRFQKPQQIEFLDWLRAVLGESR